MLDGVRPTSFRGHCTLGVDFRTYFEHGQLQEQLSFDIISRIPPY
jgi:hypothetical protein